MSHDAATSQRGEKPALFATLDIAIAQSGIKGIDADQLYALSTWSIRQGRRFPWYYKNEAHILAVEGGRDEVVVTIAGAALALMADESFVKGVDNGEVAAAACYEAGKEWRNGLRRQWGDVGNAVARKAWQNPVLFTDIVVPPDAETEGEGYGVEDWITEHAVELAGPAAEFDPENIQDPRLRRLWSQLTDKERDVLVAIADGANLAQAAELLGVGESTPPARMSRIRQKARGAAA